MELVVAENITKDYPTPERPVIVTSLPRPNLLRDDKRRFLMRVPLYRTTIPTTTLDGTERTCGDLQSS
jgi:hypothetical protein